MGPALLAAVCFALSSVFAHRTTRLVGALTANVARIWLAAGMLGVLATAHGHALRGVALGVFVVSGMVGYGLGDLPLFAAYPRLGPRLTALLMQCLSSPFAALIEWVWLGARPGTTALVCGAAILAGVGIAVAPGKLTEGSEPMSAYRTVGVVYGVLAALGQAGGAVLSRKAFALAQAAGENIDGFTASFQRVLGGVAVISAFYLLSRSFGHRRMVDPAADWRAAWPWVVATAVAGATLGVSFFQRALSTTPSAVVMPVIALTPLIVVPLAYLLERERPSVRSLLGGAVAVVAAATLAWVRVR